MSTPKAGPTCLQKLIINHEVNIVHLKNNLDGCLKLTVG